MKKKLSFKKDFEARFSYIIETLSEHWAFFLSLSTIFVWLVGYFTATARYEEFGVDISKFYEVLDYFLFVLKEPSSFFIYLLSFCFVIFMGLAIVLKPNSRKSSNNTIGVSILILFAITAYISLVGINQSNYFSIRDGFEERYNFIGKSSDHYCVSIIGKSLNGYFVWDHERNKVVMLLNDSFENIEYAIREKVRPPNLRYKSAGKSEPPDPWEVLEPYFESEELASWRVEFEKECTHLEFEEEINQLYTDSTRRYRRVN